MFKNYLGLKNKMCASKVAKYVELLIQESNLLRRKKKKKGQFG